MNLWKQTCLLLGVFILGACASYDYPGTLKVGDAMISVTGNNLEGESVSIPDDFNGQNTLLLLGYKQDSQFDIDRWLIGLDMTQTNVAVYEIPTIQGMAPRMFSTFIDNGMRSGIPKELWKGVVTVYEDGDSVQQFTGNQKPNNARVVLLNDTGVVTYFYDRGFSVAALNEVRSTLSSLN